MKSKTKIDSHQKAYVCTHVFEGIAPVLLVSRPEGDWCFLCGQVHADDSSAYRVVGIKHLLDEDESLNELEDLLPDWEAERSSTADNWIRTRLQPDS